MSEEEKLPPVPKGAKKTPLKPCDECGAMWRLEEKYWHKDPNSPDGFRNTCKKCRNEMEKRELARKNNNIIQQRIEAFDEETLKFVESLPKLTESESLPHITSYFERMNYYFGGPDGVARHTLMVYLAGSPAIRARILSKLMDMNAQVSEAGYSLPPVEMLSDEDLMRELRKRIDETKLAKLEDKSEPNGDRDNGEDDGEAMGGVLIPQP